MDPKKTHQVDQETGPLLEFAVKLGAYRSALVREGFSPAEALQMVINYQTAIIMSTPTHPTENDNGS